MALKYMSSFSFLFHLYSYISHSGVQQSDSEVAKCGIKGLCGDFLRHRKRVCNGTDVDDSLILHCYLMHLFSSV